MRPDTLRRLLVDKDVLLGAMLNMPSPPYVEFCGAVGFDWVFLDGEHELVDLRACYDLCIAADAVGVGTVVRAPANRPELLLGLAEAGAHAVVAPHINSAHDAQSLVDALRYPPRGTRGLHARTRAARYGTATAATDYYRAADAHTLPMAMIEDMDGVEALDDIVQVEGLDLFLIGPTDLSGSLGVPGELDHPRVREAVDHATTHLVAAGKVVAHLAPTPTAAATSIAAGVRMVMASTSALIGTAFRRYLDETIDLAATVSSEEAQR